MSSLRKSIERDQSDYERIRFPGDLGEIVPSEPRRDSARRGLVAMLAVAAGLLAMVSRLPEKSPPLPVTGAQRPALMDQMARASRVAKSPRPRLRLGGIAMPARPQSLTMGFPNITTSAAAVQSSNAGESNGPFRGPPRRRGDLSTPSLALRSMNDAISFGT